MTMQDNNNNKKGRAAKSAILAILTAYSAVSFAILLIWRKLAPAPLGEYEAFVYIFGKTGLIIPALIAATLWLAAVALSLTAALSRKVPRLPVKIALTTLVGVDLALHIYAFLGPGLFWNYLISATLDGAMIFCVLSDGRRGK